MNFFASMLRDARLHAWLTRAVVALAVVATVLEWVDTRIAILKVNQNPANPVVLETYPFYHSMATGMREGRIGQVDLLAYREYSLLNNPSAPFQRLPKEAEHQWRNYYTLDVGYSFIVEAARLAFPSLPDNHLRALALQLVFDAALVVFVFYLFSQWHLLLGLLAAYLYCTNTVFYHLVSFAYYYYWDIPLTFVILGALFMAHRRPADATLWLTLGAFALGCGVWLRGSWWPLGLCVVAVAASVKDLRRKLLVPLVVFTIVAAPQVLRSSLARGTLTFTTRSVWHVALVGLGYYPNPYRLKDNDGVIFELTKQKYGITLRRDDYILHDQAARTEFFEIWRKDRNFVLRSFFGRLRVSLTGRTKSSVQSFLFVSNTTHRILCLLGLAWLIARGGARRTVGLAAAGSFLIYVVLTSIFYYVGLAYDNVSQVALFVMFMGVFDAMLYLAQWLYARLPGFGAPARTISRDEVPSGA